MTHPVILNVTKRIIERSRTTREAYLSRMQEAAGKWPKRSTLSCGNLAHGFAGCGAEDKAALRNGQQPNIAIVSAYNDMLSAHQPYEAYPAIIKQEAHRVGAVAQFAGGVPAMCDGVTQGEPGMELSLFSRDVIAMSTAVALSHNMFDAALCLGICDKIVPGLLIGALSFGHLPVVFVPGGPMPSGLPNKEKARVRELYAQGKATKEELLDAEAKSYHSPGTCTFYGTANSNQMLMEVMGLQLPGSSFVNPGTKLRDAFTRAATVQAMKNSALAGQYLPLAQMLDEKAIVNGIIGLVATGGSTNHTIHLIAIARAAGIVIDWDDFAELSHVVPLLARVYPNGEADVNHFHAAGGLGFMIDSLLKNGLLNDDVTTVMGKGLEHYRTEALLVEDKIEWQRVNDTSLNKDVLRPADEPFSPEGGLRVLKGNLGRSVIKVSAVKPEHRVVEAPARVFFSQEALLEAFKKGDLHGDFVAVVAFQGPRANGMPELHKLTPTLSVLQGLGFKVALVTDGRMSGASGKVPAAIHIVPECLRGGPLAKVRDGDIILLDAEKGILEVKVDEATLAAREPASPDISHYHHGLGRELFSGARHVVTGAEDGASFVLTSHD
ncbi:MAG TPA: phosphogluconate dehydratase [Rickettsiales bacterium]|nr:phosphogluconate dehydratase [Rickettsiales bacterium]